MTEGLLSLGLESASYSTISHWHRSARTPPPLSICPSTAFLRWQELRFLRLSDIVCFSVAFRLSSKWHCMFLGHFYLNSKWYCLCFGRLSSQQQVILHVSRSPFISTASDIVCVLVAFPLSSMHSVPHRLDWVISWQQATCSVTVQFALRSQQA